MSDDTTAYPWRTSRCSGALYQCVEVQVRPDGVRVRNSRDPQGPTLELTLEEWETFRRGVEAGDFQHPE
jgi:Domain of unknown function (DUF397)